MERMRVTTRKRLINPPAKIVISNATKTTGKPVIRPIKAANLTSPAPIPPG